MISISDKVGESITCDFVCGSRIKINLSLHYELCSVPYKEVILTSNFNKFQPIDEERDRISGDETTPW